MCPGSYNKNPEEEEEEEEDEEEDEEEEDEDEDELLAKVAFPERYTRPFLEMDGRIKDTPNYLIS